MSGSNHLQLWTLDSGLAGGEGWVVVCVGSPRVATVHQFPNPVKGEDQR